MSQGGASRCGAPEPVCCHPWRMLGAREVRNGNREVFSILLAGAQVKQTELTKDKSGGDHGCRCRWTRSLSIWIGEYGNGGPCLPVSQIHFPPVWLDSVLAGVTGDNQPARVQSHPHGSCVSKRPLSNRASINPRVSSDWANSGHTVTSHHQCSWTTQSR